uniref:Uncharacterized protein n=1 Tax=Oryzias melastigma TaxID=30732 RepID=A0A3B3DUJ4_ORYME
HFANSQPCLGMMDITIQLKSIRTSQSPGRWTHAERQLTVQVFSIKLVQNPAGKCIYLQPFAGDGRQCESQAERLLHRTHGNQVMLNCKEVGHKLLSFDDTSIMATELLNSRYEYDQGWVSFNNFRSIISNKMDQKSVFCIDVTGNSENTDYPSFKALHKYGQKKKTLLTCFKSHGLSSLDASHCIKQLSLDILIHFSVAFARSREKRIVEVRLNKAAAVINHQILIKHNPVLGGRGKPLFFYFHL